ncbi:1,4-alpha-glucan-branching enzyme 1, chloroplastic/amyloplastic isoform X1 [Amborella trichopoda]|uniref:1,4-alpha-glucan-branching enzyme 1, chloroplastic/amyloplastic isoform X1 n=2 Tax=Amborella trichopoda TaxID=13333 RepID=UPI0005D2ED97|nr:1,4-alpha-glucan-branching enzyme 1, chloroplastic/amyloplastic isoform X1 [Amborella trichopoda]|eukprot:XP_011628895.1 1,4-alpha-glucan-branching enzyme 1, chloroplastic/amyloplastic isoform X1 [Amborella trichopoda]
MKTFVSLASHSAIPPPPSSITSFSKNSSGQISISYLQPIWAADRYRKNFPLSSIKFQQRLPGFAHEKIGHHSAISTAIKDTSITTHEEMENMDIFHVDPYLEKCKDHLFYRWRRYTEQKEAIEKYEGSLEDFARGYLKFGFIREDDGIVYREWAPAAQEAQLIGDFNGWHGSNHSMVKNQFGVWTIKIPDSNGKSPIPHGSKVKFHFKHDNGVWVDRIPAWITYATVDPTIFAAPYDGVYWDPPPSERYQFQYPRPPKPEAPRIYEAHVGMSSEEPRVSSYREFADNVLPRIKKNNYNTVQLMAIMEHSYYGSFGYHVTNFFAVSSRSGTPEDLKYLIDKAHSLGLQVLMDVVHSHASNNVTDGLNGFDVGQSTQLSYFHTEERGYHKLWDSRLFNYNNWEVLRFLLSNLRWWLDEYNFDGFRFDGVTSMLYHHHGINKSFTGDYSEYFGFDTDVDAVVYLMLANTVIHSILPDATVIAEDVSGMPTLGRPVSEGGVGFDYRLAMGIPDRWIDYLKNKSDDQWSMQEITSCLINRRYSEKCIAYAESHDQAIVGDKTMAFLLMDKDMYIGMSALEPASPIVDRGIALHKMIHFITMALGGDGYLNFMGNEFGHPEWIDFPREGNGWSYDKCRRQWNLVDTDHLRYKFMNAFDRAMNALEDSFQFLSSTKQIVSYTSDEEKVIVFERGDLVFVFNFHTENTYDGFKVGCDLPGKYRVALDSDALEFGGHGRVGHDVDHFTSPEGEPGKPETNFNNRPNSFKVLSPPQTCVAYYKVDESLNGIEHEAAEVYKAEEGLDHGAQEVSQLSNMLEGVEDSDLESAEVSEEDEEAEPITADLVTRYNLLHQKMIMTLSSIS